MVTSDFMRATLNKADEVKGYFMTDSSTWVAAKKDLPNLTVLFRGDPFLVNVYHALCRADGTFPNNPHAVAFVEFAVSAQGQQIVRNYGRDRYGEAMYRDAVYASQFE